MYIEEIEYFSESKHDMRTSALGYRKDQKFEWGRLSNIPKRLVSRLVLIG